MDTVRRMRRGLRCMKQIQPSNQHAVSGAEPGGGDQQPAQKRRERTWLPPNPWGRGGTHGGPLEVVDKPPDLLVVELAAAGNRLSPSSNHREPWMPPHLPSPTCISR
ncbi:hypothetical protein OsI_02080 [Oryza sativa Indica Group]|uniref:Uncharacterized protein n=1 Tax=Oryza sativa subsp. indica TaxID=39946 RepID=A2WQF4_ORYSI|nr:hypothetical protein OsI_02080 [Oryza sativa Indica Group]